MTDTIPRTRAWLALWTVDQAGTPQMRCLTHDGPLPEIRAAKLAQIGGFQRPVDPEESLTDLFDLFATSPGWVDPHDTLAQFARIDHDPGFREQTKRDIERRKAMTIDCRTWEEVARVLHANGEMTSSTLAALGVAA